MKFIDVLNKTDFSKISSISEHASDLEVKSILSKEKITFEDYIILLSETAVNYLEEMARKAQMITQKFFGKTILLYAPIYLSNECDNSCIYCGFNQKVSGKRISLSVSEVIKEADFLYDRGFRHILLVSGEKKGIVSIAYLKEIVSTLHKKFESISIEIFPLEENEYKELFSVGVDGITIYQEVYDKEIYKKVHPAGPKSDYEFRLATPERAGRVGFYRINIGALLGLGEFQKEAACVGLHASYLRKKFWKSQISISFPRIQGSGANFKPINPISDKQLVQMLCALRLFLPQAGLVLSTRESGTFRDNLISLGTTQMSAESKTSPGGYLNCNQEGEQFNVSDKRSVEEVSQAIKLKGYEPVFKDWDKALTQS